MTPPKNKTRHSLSPQTANTTPALPAVPHQPQPSSPHPRRSSSSSRPLPLLRPKSARQNVPASSQSPLLLPKAWLWFFEEWVPNFVKAHFSPKEAWKKKPFEKSDARFFFRGIEELSELFTEDRAKGLNTYFQHPRFRSAYLLYFLPLQAAKFVALFQKHPLALKAALAHAKKAGVFRVVDLGAGPGTASLSLLLSLMDQAFLNSSQPSSSGPSTEGGAGDVGDVQELPRIELHWFDTQSEIMKIGKRLVEDLADHFTPLRGKVTVHLHVQPWWQARQKITEPCSLTFMGHVLNEAKAPVREAERFWEQYRPLAQGGGILWLEPAARRPSQQLAQLRDQLLVLGLGQTTETPTAAEVWGPCLHAGHCPLAEGRDWCHFSYPMNLPGEWFSYFSTSLSSKRHWLKLSYLWLAHPDSPAPLPSPFLRRVISDPLSNPHEGIGSTVLLCEPETALRWKAPLPRPGVPGLQRGDLTYKS